MDTLKVEIVISGIGAREFDDALEEIKEKIEDMGLMVDIGIGEPEDI